MIEREHRYLEASLLSSSCVLLFRVHSVYAVWRARGYLEASLCSSSCGLLFYVRSRARMK